MALKVLKLPEAPAWIRPYVREKCHFWLHDTCYHYALIDARAFRETFETAPVRFAMNKDGFLAVSDSVAEQDRPLAIYHEALCVSGDQHEGKCVETVGIELDAAKFFGFGRKSLGAYIARRYGFFADLVASYEEMSPRDRDTALLRRLYRSKAYLAACIETIPAAHP